MKIQYPQSGMTVTTIGTIHRQWIHHSHHQTRHGFELRYAPLGQGMIPSVSHHGWVSKDQIQVRSSLIKNFIINQSNISCTLVQRSTLLRSSCAPIIPVSGAAKKVIISTLASGMLWRLPTSAYRARKCWPADDLRATAQRFRPSHITKHSPRFGLKREELWHLLRRKLISYNSKSFPAKTALPKSRYCCYLGWCHLLCLFLDR
jgi:hypothetical protein